MRLSTYLPGVRRVRFATMPVTALVALITAVSLFTLTHSVQAASMAVSLGTADSFAVLAGSGITNTGPTTINGDIGTFPTTTITGTGTLTLTGTNHGGSPSIEQPDYWWYRARSGLRSIRP